MLSHNPRDIRLLMHYGRKIVANLTEFHCGEGLPEIPGWEPHEVLALHIWLATKELARENPDKI